MEPLTGTCVCFYGTYDWYCYAREYMIWLVNPGSIYCKRNSRNWILTNVFFLNVAYLNQSLLMSSLLLRPLFLVQELLEECVQVSDNLVWNHRQLEYVVFCRYLIFLVVCSGNKNGLLLPHTTTDQGRNHFRIS